MPAKRKRKSNRSGGFLSLLSSVSVKPRAGGRLLGSRRSANPGQALLAMAIVAVTGISIAYAGFAATSAYSLFSNSDKPAEIATWDNTPVELGLRFSARTEGTVTGTVSMDGQPLKEGLIRFEPTGPNAAPICDRSSRPRLLLVSNRPAAATNQRCHG